MTSNGAGPEEAYPAAHADIALVDRSELGRLVMRGEDALDLLHRLSTQDLHALSPGEGTRTVLTNEKGRIIDVLTVLHLDSRLLLVCSPGNQAEVGGWLEKYTIIEDCDTADVTQETGLLTFFGPKAGALAEAVGGESASRLQPYGHMPVPLGGLQALLVRTPEPPDGGYYVWMHRVEDTPPAMEHLLKAGERLAARPIDRAGYDALRIEAGIPAFGREIDQRFNPLEAGLSPLISWNKGCYIGQEVVARLDTYDKVQKHLMGLLLPDGELPPEGAKLYSDGKEAGFVTSAVNPPRRGHPIALAYVRTAHAQAGAVLAVETPSGRIEATTVHLPFE